MSTCLKPYSEYRDSGLWLDPIPTHWQVRRFKNLLTELDARSTHGAEQLLSVSQYTGVTPRRLREGTSEADTRASSLVGYKRVDRNDLIINIMLAWNGSLGVSNYTGIVSPAYCVYRFKNLTQPWYYHELLRLPAYKERIKTFSTGVVESRLRLYTDDLFRIEALLPPQEEQEAIVRFIRHIDQRVNRLIRAKRRLIELLNEQKQAIIHQAVTRGLDPNVRLKPSGVEWLGEIPEGWTVKPLKRWVSTKITDGPHESPEFLDEGVDFVSAEAMVNGRIEFSRRRGFISREAHNKYCGKCRPQRDDIFMCKSGATTGKVAIVNTDAEFSVWSPLALIRCDRKVVNSHLLFRVLQTNYVMEQVRDSWSYGTQPNLGMGKMERIMIALPPIGEQSDIFNWLVDELEPFEIAGTKALSEIELIREYRTRLISDVVTGKLDVRGVDLPNLVGEIEWTNDEYSESEEGEEALDGDAVEESL